MAEQVSNFIATELIFYSNLKVSGKIPLAVCQGNQHNVNLWAGLQEYVIPVALSISHIGK